MPLWQVCLLKLMFFRYYCIHRICKGNLIDKDTLIVPLKISMYLVVIFVLNSLFACFKLAFNEITS